MCKDAEAGAIARSAALPSERQRFFIITAGRTGSTLLASILAENGAEFDMPPASDWNVSRGGDMELAEIRAAADHFRVAFERSPRKPVAPVAKRVWTRHVSSGKKRMARALARARYVKAVNLDLAVPHAIKIGYFPRIIVSYRPFTEFAVSLSQSLGPRSLSAIGEDYDRIYRNALLQLHTFGGCAISYAELTDSSRTEWAHALAEVTGIPATALLASQARRLRPGAPVEQPMPVLSEAAQWVHAQLEQCAGRAVPPSAQALRNWAQKTAPPPVRSERHATARRGLNAVATEAMALCAAVIDRRVPWYSRAVAAACIVGYFIVPWDPIPNRLAYIGHLDDAIAIVISACAFLRVMPASILRQLRLEASIWLAGRT